MDEPRQAGYLGSKLDDAWARRVQEAEDAVIRVFADGNEVDRDAGRKAHGVLHVQILTKASELDSTCTYYQTYCFVSGITGVIRATVELHERPRRRGIDVRAELRQEVLQDHHVSIVSRRQRNQHLPPNLPGRDTRHCNQ